MMPMGDKKLRLAVVDIAVRERAPTRSIGLSHP
jgi:hypothetical protein